MKPTPPCEISLACLPRHPWISSRCPASLVRLKLVLCPTLSHVLPAIRPLGFAHLCRSRPHGSVHSLLPSSFYLLCRLARRSIRQAHALPPYCCSTLAVAYDVFFPRNHPSAFPSMSHHLIRLQSESLTLSDLPIHVARIPAAPFPRAPFFFSLDG